MASRTRGVILLLLCATTAACSSPDPGAFMAMIDVPVDGVAQDGGGLDGSTSDATSPDVAADQGLPSDGSVGDTSEPDASTDSSVVRDAQNDAAPDAASVDATADARTPDAVVVDVSSEAVSPDVSLTDGASDVPRDASVDATADAPRDASADSTPADVARDVAAADTPTADGGCSGAAPMVTVTAPTTDEMIETCTVSGVPLYYDFRANVVASTAIRSVTAEWRLPSGSLAPPSPPALSAAPFVWRRQVGGAMTAGGIPPLAILDGAMRGTWHFEVTATDTCGRSTMVSQPFTLLYTMIRRCPNP